MSDTLEHDTLYLTGKGLITAALIGIGYVSGASLPLLVPIAAAVGGNWLSNMCERGFESYRKTWLTPAGALNHHLSRALQRSFKDAIRHLQEEWKQSPRYKKLDSFDREKSRLALKWLAEDAPRLLDKALLEATAQQGLLPAVQRDTTDSYAPFRDLIKEPVKKHCGENTALARFLLDELPPTWISYLTQVLTTDEDARAAYERLWQVSITQALAQIEAQTSATQAEVATLRADFAKLTADLKADPAALPVLNADALVRALEGQVVPYLQRIEGKLDEIGKDVSAIRKAVEQRATPAETLAAAHALLAQLPTATLPAHAAPPPASRVAFGRDLNFIGREPELLALARALTTGTAAAITPTVALTAPGGYGKTALTVEFVSRYGQFFAGGVFWLSAADADAITAEIAQCGGRGHLNLAPDFHTLPLPDQVGLVQREWRSNLPRLIVCDNADSEASVEQLRELLPTSGGCRILITSRRATWDRDRFTMHPLGVPPRAESIALLQHLAPHLSEADADAVAAEVGDLPLALHLSGSYLNFDPTTDVATYLAELRAAPLQHESLQGVDVSRSSTNHELHVWRTFKVSYDRLAPAEATDALALRWLQHASHFAPGIGLPVDLVTQSLALPDGTPARAPRRALRRLLDLGLLESTPDAPVLHRLLAAFVQQSVQDSGAQERVEDVIVYHCWASIETGNTAPLVTQFQHLLHVLAPIKQREAADTQRRIDAFLASGLVNTSLRNVAAAEDDLKRADELLGAAPETPATATQVAWLCYGMGTLLENTDPLDAAEWLERGLQRRAYLAPAVLAPLLMRLGSVQIGLEDYPVARELNREALQRLPPEAIHWQARTLHNLGIVYAEDGESAQAMESYEQARILCEKIHDEWTLASIHHNLGIEQQIVGQWAKAAESYHAALVAAKTLNDREVQSTVLLAWGMLLTWEGQDDAAFAKLAESRSVAENFNLDDIMINILASRADLHIRRAEWDMAKDCLEQAAEISEQLGIELEQAELQRHWAQVHAGEGNYEAAGNVAQQAVEASAGGSLYEAGLSQRVLGQVLAMAQDEERASDAFEQSLHLLEPYSSYEHACTQLAFGQFLLAGTDRARGAALVSAAQQTFAQLGAQRDLRLATEGLETSS